MPAQEERSAVVPPASGVKLTSVVGKPSGCVLLYSVRSVLFQVARECLAYILIRQPPCRLFILRDECGSAVERSVNSCDGVEATCLGHREAQTVFVPAVLAKARRWVALTHSRSSEDIGVNQLIVTLEPDTCVRTDTSGYECLPVSAVLVGDHIFGEQFQRRVDPEYISRRRVLRDASRAQSRSLCATEAPLAVHFKATRFMNIVPEDL